MAKKGYIGVTANPGNTENGTAREIKKAYIGIIPNIVNTEKSFTVVNNGNISFRDKQIVFHYAVEKDTYFFMPLTQTLLNGKTYIVSFDCSGVDPETRLTILVDNKHQNQMLLKNGRMSLEYVPDRDISTQLLMDDYTNWVNVVGKEIILSNFTVEEYGANAVARRITKAYIGDGNGVARQWY